MNSSNFFSVEWYKCWMSKSSFTQGLLNFTIFHELNTWPGVTRWDINTSVNKMWSVYELTSFAMSGRKTKTVKQSLSKRRSKRRLLKPRFRLWFLWLCGCECYNCFSLHRQTKFWFFFHCKPYSDNLERLFGPCCPAVDVPIFTCTCKWRPRRFVSRWSCITWWSSLLI